MMGCSMSRSMLEKKFKLKSEFKPEGDQPEAIKKLMEGIKKGMPHQTLLGVTGSGKTFTAANIIKQVNKPVLVIAHNKTLAAQLAEEYRQFFPENAVHYFVSYYDYYQPEAYMPITDTYIEKDAKINEEIDRLRHASTQALLSRRDVIIVASVSCIYGLGNPKEYQEENLKLNKGMEIDRTELLKKLIHIHFERTNADLTPGTFRAIGNTVEIMPSSEKNIWTLHLSGGTKQKIEKIHLVDAISRKMMGEEETIFIFPAKHFLIPQEERERAIKDIADELVVALKNLKKEGKNLEAERLKRRTNYDLAMIKEVGYCSGIENYSRHLSGRKPGEAPDTLLSYFPKDKDGKPDFLTIVDESHVTIPQIGGMCAGDQSRKKTLVEFGFRLPSAKDNRPLRFNEFSERVGQIIYTTATPADYEREVSGQIVEQIIRPTGLIDPQIDVRPIIEGEGYKGQVFDLIQEAEKTIKSGERVLVTTLTKKMAEEFSEYLKEKGIKAEYLHSDVKTIERIKILTEFRRGKFDCIVGVNLLREGLDLPEVSLIGILDADKEGFLRSETALIQTIGRAARNVNGRVILYADNITGSMKRAIDETNRRRGIQLEYNKKHGITPKTILKNISDITDTLEMKHKKAVGKLLVIDRELFMKNPKALIKEKERQMSEAVKILDFETAAILRDEIKELRSEF
ncbi:MAG: UvrABC system protein B [Parcubacteria group bacterium GW2011_GWF2_38_76]|nr:MAG: UvrABC system protein B [Parcubacteria group bacterium GW2011_GWF2_38_76]